jgi:hypothetical protein
MSVAQKNYLEESLNSWKLSGEGEGLGPHKFDSSFLLPLPDIFLLPAFLFLFSQNSLNICQGEERE